MLKYNKIDYYDKLKIYKCEKLKILLVIIIDDYLSL